MKRFKSSSYNAVFLMILIFASLQVFFNIFFSKLGVKWRRLWNSTKALNSVYPNWNYSCFLFRNDHFHNVISTLTNVVKLYVEKDNVVSTLSDIAHIKVQIHNVASTLFDVVNSNVEIHNVVSTLIWGCIKSWRHINQKTTLKQRWNVCWVYT